MKNRIFKNRIISILIVALVVSPFRLYAAGFVDTDNGRYYVDDQNQFAVNCWRWIDEDNDTVAECYRFDKDGHPLANATTSYGKMTDMYGRWVVDGIVQKIYTKTYKPLSGNVKRHIDIEPKTSTDSVTRINSTGKDIYMTIEDQEKKAKKKAKGSPLAIFSPSEAGYILGKKVKLERPEGGNSQGLVIDKFTVEEEYRYLGEGENIVAGRDMRQLITASKNFTKNLEKAKIWGGEEWSDVMCLSGNGAYVKFDLTKYNYFSVEVAHQTHGKSTSDTFCYIEFYINDDLIEGYDKFNDNSPQTISEWVDDGKKTIELRLVVEGDAKGRKVYLRNARVRNIK